jgi:hypothetical protein
VVVAGIFGLISGDGQTTITTTTTLARRRWGFEDLLLERDAQARQGPLT